MVPDVFVSYAREDEPRIARLAHALEGTGKTVFWDHRIPAGKPWRSWIGQALKSARCVVVVWTRSSVESEWVITEAEEARRRSVLVPVLLDRVDPPFGFAEIQAADLSGSELRVGEAVFDRFVKDLEGALSGSGPPGPLESEGVAPKTAAPVATIARAEAAPPPLPRAPASGLGATSQAPGESEAPDVAEEEPTRAEQEVQRIELAREEPAPQWRLASPRRWTGPVIAAACIGLALLVGLIAFWPHNRVRAPPVPAAGATAAAAASASIRGTVLERLDARPYSYIRLATDQGETWAAIPYARITLGQDVTIEGAMPMNGFESKTLKRKFEVVYFGTLQAR